MAIVFTTTQPTPSSTIISDIGHPSFAVYFISATNIRRDTAGHLCSAGSRPASLIAVLL